MKKLIFFNNYYINNTSDEEILETINKINSSEFEKINIEKTIILKLISLFKKRSLTLIEIKEKVFKIFKKKYKYKDNEQEILDLLEKNKSFIIKEFSSIVTWNEYIIDEKLKFILDKLNLKFKQLGQPLRLILSGNLDGPSVAKLMEIIGKKFP